MIVLVKRKMNEIKVKNKECCLCGSKNTEAKVKWIDNKYRIVVKCNNTKCISNNLNENGKR